MPDTLTKPAIGAVQHRSVPAMLRAKADDTGDVSGFEFSGIGVPYDTEIEMFGWRERFAPGSIEGAESALVLWRHNDPIGKVTRTEDTADGCSIDGRISQTERGRDAAVLLRDEVVTKLSIGFEPREYHIEVDDNGQETIVYDRAIAHEFSLVPFPAYDTAAISDVRERPSTPDSERNTPMPETLTRATLDEAMQARDRELAEKMEDFERALARVETNTAPSGPGAGSQYRSMGHFLKELSKGDEAAAEFHRAYAGGTDADDVVKNTPIGEFIKWVEARLTTINMFSRGTLPPDGNTVEFVRMPAQAPTAGKNTAVAKQTAEGANLKGPFKIKLEDDNAQIETWGGWTELSRQRIERSQHNYLDKVLRVMGLEWARYAESRFKTYFQEQLTARAADALVLPGTPDYTDYLGAIVDAGDYYASNGFVVDGLALSPNRFKELALVEAADGRPLMSVYGSGTNITGELNLPKGHGNLAGVPVSVVWDTQGIGTFYDESALQIDMSPGAPAQLQDENIINLTKQFSIYGYAAMYDPFPGGLLPLSYGNGNGDGSGEGGQG